MKPRNLILTSILIICVGLAPKAHAISPPPDGGYPSGNTAEGQAALLSLTTGGFNTAIGSLSLRNNVEGDINTAIGDSTVLNNTGNDNAAIGAGAMVIHGENNINSTRRVY